VPAAAYIIQYPGGRAEATTGAFCSLLQYHSPPSPTDPEMAAYTRALEACFADLRAGVLPPADGWGTVTSSDSEATLTASYNGGRLHIPRRAWDDPQQRTGIAAATARAAIRTETGRPVHESHTRAAHGRQAGPTYGEQVNHSGNTVVDSVAKRTAAQATTQDMHTLDQRYSGIPAEYAERYLLTHNGAVLNGKIRELVGVCQDYQTAARVERSGAACSRMARIAASGAIHPDATAAARQGLNTTELNSLVYSMYRRFAASSLASASALASSLYSISRDSAKDLAELSCCSRTKSSGFCIFCWCGSFWV